MDSQMPEIRPVVRREEKKKKGFFGSLFSRFGMGGAGGVEGAGSLGGLEGLGGAGLGGGILATKAGIIGLIVAGSTVAGGIGLVGYKVFGPSSADRAGGYSSLFDARPKDSQQADGEQGGASDGKSASLQYLAQANAGKVGEQQKTDTMTDAMAVAAKSASAGAPHDNNAAPGGGKPASLLKPGKFGALSAPGGGGGGGGSGASAGAAVPRTLIASAKPLSAAGALTPGKSLKGLQGVGALSGKKGAMGQLKAVYGDQYSASPGRTYDGNGRNGMGGGQGLSMGGMGESGGKGNANPTLNPSSMDNRFPPPVTDTTNVTPWQKAINMAAMLMLGAIALLVIANKLLDAAVDKTGLTAHAGPLIMMAKVLAGAAAAMGLLVIALGAMIGGSKYGQSTQGGIFTLSGAFVTAAATAMLSSIWGVNANSAAKEVALDNGAWGVMMACGAAALIGTIAAYMSKPKVYPSSEFNNGKPPDEHLIKATMPSEDVLVAFLPDPGEDRHA